VQQIPPARDALANDNRGLGGEVKASRDSTEGAPKEKKPRRGARAVRVEGGAVERKPYSAKGQTVAQAEAIVDGGAEDGNDSEEGVDDGVCTHATRARDGGRRVSVAPAPTQLIEQARRVDALGNGEIALRRIGIGSEEQGRGDVLAPETA
jgi:hypothetical protein